MKPPQKQRGLLTVDLSAELRSAFDAWCSKARLTPSDALRQAVQGLVAAETSATQAPGLFDGRADGAAAPMLGATPAFRVVARPDTGPTERCELRMTPSEAAAVASVAEQEGYAVQDWVLAAVRAGLAAAPAFGQSQLEALVASNRLLAGVALDLAAVRKGEGSERPADLERVIRAHIEAVSAMMASAVRRWTLQRLTEAKPNRRGKK